MLTDSKKHGAVGMETFWNWEGPEAFMCYQGHPDVHPQGRQSTAGALGKTQRSPRSPSEKSVLCPVCVHGCVVLSTSRWEKELQIRKQSLSNARISAVVRREGNEVVQSEAHTGRGTFRGSH